MELAALLGTDKTIQKLSYTKLIDSFKQMLIPKKNVVVSQHYFLNIYQKEKQTIFEFVAAYKVVLQIVNSILLVNVSRSTQLQRYFLRAQFIRDLQDVV